MATVTLELDDEIYAALEAEAEKDRCSVADLLEEWVLEKARAADEDRLGREAARRHLDRYPSLFKRLAE